MTSSNQAPKNSAEHPFSVSTVNNLVSGWVDRLGPVWIEGELSQVSINPDWFYNYFTLHDTQADAFLALTVPRQVVASLPRRPEAGDRIVVLGKFTYYTKKGTVSLRVEQLRYVGEGELLMRIEQLRQQLAAEGLTSPARKRRLPMLPSCIGLIAGANSHAERDVLRMAKRRWSNVRFRRVSSAVQGPEAVPELIQALRALDADPEVDVIIIARGGGSVEDLLPFSEEALQRAVAAAGTPIVSAIGHQKDNPVLDDVADVRAATPTNAAEIVVPDEAAERALFDQARTRMNNALRNWVRREQQHLAQVRARPVLSDPMRDIDEQKRMVGDATDRIRRQVSNLLARETSEIASLRKQVASLGPAATLARGYSVVQVQVREGSLIDPDGTDPSIVTSISQATPGAQLRIRVADGSITAATLATAPAD